MQKSIIILIITSIFWGCSSSYDTTNMTPEERLNFAKNLYQQEDYQEAIDEFQALILQYPGSTIIDDSQYYLSMSRFMREEYILAAFEFSKLIKNMSTSEFLADAQFMLAECYYRLSPEPELDQSYTKKAIEEYQAFIDFFPLNEKVLEAEQKIRTLNTKLAKKEYDTARIYEKMEFYNASMKYYDSVMELYHDTEYAPLALYNKIFILDTRKSPSKALEESNKFIDKYPDHPNAKEVIEFKNDLEKRLSANK
jgi:outer membrane protein assembly factor BamD